MSTTTEEAETAMVDSPPRSLIGPVHRDRLRPLARGEMGYPTRLTALDDTEQRCLDELIAACPYWDSWRTDLRRTAARVLDILRRYPDLAAGMDDDQLLAAFNSDILAIAPPYGVDRRPEFRTFLSQFRAGLGSNPDRPVLDEPVPAERAAHVGAVVSTPTGRIGIALRAEGLSYVVAFPDRTIEAFPLSRLTVARQITGWSDDEWRQVVEGAVQRERGQWEDDARKASAILSREADEHGLCNTYDEVLAEINEVTYRLRLTRDDEGSEGDRDLVVTVAMPSPWGWAQTPEVQTTVHVTVHWECERGCGCEISSEHISDSTVEAAVRGFSGADRARVLDWQFAD